MIAPIEETTVLDPLLRKLQRLVLLNAAEQDQLRLAFSRRRHVGKGEMICEENGDEKAVTVLLSGLALSFRTPSCGQRHTVAAHLPGDLIDLNVFLLGAERRGVTALTSCVVAAAPYGQAKALIEGAPRIALCLWSDQAADAMISTEWLTGMGRRSAMKKVAYFICEMQARYEMTGLSDGNVLPFPITQDRLSELIGLSPVHTNRVLQQLRSMGLIRKSRLTLTVLDPIGLRAFAGFDPAYLTPPDPAFHHRPIDPVRAPFDVGDLAVRARSQGHLSA